MEFMNIETSKGQINLPAYLPVSTFGGEYPLDDLIRPFLPRFCDMIMVSFHYAKQMQIDQELPIFIDSGGFAVLLAGSEVMERPDGTGIILQTTEESVTEITPEAVLALQESKGQWGSSLDFPVPPSMTNVDEMSLRIRLTLANAQWAIQNKKCGDLRLFGSVQGWDLASYVDCAKQLLNMGYQDLALGGFVPRASNLELLTSVTRNVRSLMRDGGLLHAFGIGEPRLVSHLFAAGATSIDSSSFVRAAASGKRWDGEWGIENPSGLERAHAAIANLRYAIRETRQDCLNGSNLEVIDVTF